MRFASMRNLDISNGEGVGVSLFVQGCDRHCFNCFNPDTWDFNGGKEWTEEAKNKFMKLIARPYINRISILGGEPLAEQNLDEVLSLIKEIRNTYSDKTIWLYTGYKFEQIKDAFTESKKWLQASWKHSAITRWEIISNVNVLVDGEYIDEQRDITKKWAGSSNQRVIDVEQSLVQNKVVLYCN